MGKPKTASKNSKNNSSHSPKPSPKFKSVGIVIKRAVPEANALALDISKKLKERGLTPLFAMESKEVCDLAFGKACATKEELVERCDLIIVLGGDGTFVSVARLMGSRSVPLLGVNMGTLGFLTEVKKSEAFDAIDQALAGKLPIGTRTMLECTLTRKGKELLRAPVVNDVVISKGAIARIFDMRITSDGALVTDFKGDGLILSSPTGSTAYGMAAGGPIVAPGVPAIELAPICPHSLTLRPLILPDSSHIRVVPNYRSGTVILTLDGQMSIDLQSGDEIEVTKFKKHPIQIIQWPERDYFALLREKLKYGFRD